MSREFLRFLARTLLRYPVLKKRLANFSDLAFQPVRPELLASPLLRDSFSGEPIKYPKEIGRVVPETGVCELKGGRLLSLDGWPQDSTGLLVSEATFYRGRGTEMKGNRLDGVLPKIRLPGRVLSLVSDFSHHNYGHFLLDSVTRLALIEEQYPDWKSRFDSIVVAGPKLSWKSSLLSRAGIPMEKVVWINRRPLWCEHLTFTTFPGGRLVYTQWQVEFLRSLFGSTQPQKGRRLFVRRLGVGRQLLNEARLLKLAEDYGFEPYLPEQSKNPIGDFEQAEAVIGTHGAGLSDICFMHPGSSVLELMPDDHQLSYFVSLGGAASLQYSVIIGQTRGEGHRSGGPSNQAFEVDEALFHRYLDEHFTGPKVAEASRYGSIQPS